MPTLAKFLCIEKTEQPTVHAGQHTVMTTVRLQAVNRGDRIPHPEGNDYGGEDSVFGEATPHGEIVMGIANPEAARAFGAGRSYYVTFEEAPQDGG